MSFNPLSAVGMVLRRQEAGAYTYNGSCFSVQDSTTAMTARHCVEGLTRDSLAVRFPRVLGDDEPVRVGEVLCHPEADVALLRLQLEPWVLLPFGTSFGGAGSTPMLLLTAFRRMS
jgi:hypothetical protein